MFGLLCAGITLYNVKVKTDLLENGYKEIQAIVSFDEEKKKSNELEGVNVLYTVDDKIYKGTIQRENYYFAYINGAALNIIYDTENPENFEIYSEKEIAQHIKTGLFMIIVPSALGIFILAKLYPEQKKRRNFEYRKNEYIDAKILSSYPQSRLILVDDSGEKIRVFRSIPNYKQEHMVQFFKMKNVDKIRVYFGGKNKDKIIVDMPKFERGDENVGC